MYDFVGINEVSREQNLPSEALVLNGEVIEGAIPGYRTLNVTGRELLGKELNTTQRTGGDGDIFLGSSYPGRTITVRYQLEAKSNELFRRSFNELNKMLSGEQKEIRFRDELDYAFYGTLEAVGSVPAGTNSIVSEFSFYCSDPYKYGKPLVVTGGDSVKAILDDHFPVTPEYIVVTPDNDTNTLTVRAQDKEIKLVDGSFMAGDSAVINLREQEVTDKNGNLMSKLALSSNLEDFLIKSGELVTFIEGGQIELAVREMQL